MRGSCGATRPKAITPPAAGGAAPSGIRAVEVVPVAAPADVFAEAPAKFYFCCCALDSGVPDEPEEELPEEFDEELPVEPEPLL